MTPSPPPSWTAYDQDTQKYIDDYSQLYFSKIHRKFIEFLPKTKNSKVLDVGCGSGRDARSLAKRGYSVTAIDPSIEMLSYAKSHNNHPNITWLVDCLPSLGKLKDEKYKFILLSAVWMHIHPSQRSCALERLTSLLDKDGYLAITLRISTPDTARVMYQVSTNELLRLASIYSLTPAYISRPNRDSLDRKSIKWEKVVLHRSNISSAPRS